MVPLRKSINFYFIMVPLRKSINFYFIMVPFKKKGLQRGTPKPRISGFRRPAERNVISLGFVTPKWEFPKIGGTLFGRSS